MIPMTIFDANCLYVLKCLALVFVAAPCVLFAGGMLICLLIWCGLHITRAMHLRRLGLPRCGRCRYWATVQCPLYGRNTAVKTANSAAWAAMPTASATRPTAPRMPSAGPMKSSLPIWTACRKPPLP